MVLLQRKLGTQDRSQVGMEARMVGIPHMVLPQRKLGTQVEPTHKRTPRVHRKVPRRPMKVCAPTYVKHTCLNMGETNATLSGEVFPQPRRVNRPARLSTKEDLSQTRA